MFSLSSVHSITQQKAIKPDLTSTWRSGAIVYTMQPATTSDLADTSTRSLTDEALMSVSPASNSRKSAGEIEVSSDVDNPPMIQSEAEETVFTEDKPKPGRQEATVTAVLKSFRTKNDKPATKYTVYVHLVRKLESLLWKRTLVNIEEQRLLSEIQEELQCSLEDLFKLANQEHCPRGGFNTTYLKWLFRTMEIRICWCLFVSHLCLDMSDSALSRKFNLSCIKKEEDRREAWERLIVYLQKEMMEELNLDPAKVTQTSCHSGAVNPSDSGEVTTRDTVRVVPGDFGERQDFSKVMRAYRWLDLCLRSGQDPFSWMGIEASLS